MPYPTDRKYTKEHEWIQANGNSGTIGITDYAQQSLGDIVFVETPKVGADTEVNAALANSPENVNKDAHGSWMVKITLKNPSELDGLLSAADYEKFVAEEAGH